MCVCVGGGGVEWGGGGGNELIIGDRGREEFRRYLIPNFSSDIMETAS